MDNFIISGFSDEIDSNIDVQFQGLNKLGISYFEPRCINDKNISELSDCEVLNLKEKMNEYKISASSVGSPVGKIDICDDFNGELRKLKKVIKTAKAIGAEYIRIFSFYITDNNYEKHRSEVINRLKIMAEIAGENDIVLLHENEKGIYGDTPERCKDILSSVDSKNLRAVFDPANFVQCFVETYPYAFYMLKPYIEYMHIKDARGSKVVPAGMGDGHIEEILNELKQDGYKGFLSLEPHLGSFEGLAELEKGDEMTKLEKSDLSKFKIAYDSLKKIISKIN